MHDDVHLASLLFVYCLLLGNCGYQNDRKIYNQSEIAARLRCSRNPRAARATKLYTRSARINIYPTISLLHRIQQRSLIHLQWQIEAAKECLQIYLSPFPMLLLNLGLYIYQCVKASNQSSITRLWTIIATVGLVLGILEDVKITHFEPVYVQQIKLLETIN